MDGEMDGGWTLGVCYINNFGTGWSRKVGGMVTEAGRDGKVVKNERFTVI